MSQPDQPRVNEARRLLADLGFDQERTNERSALVLLALLRLMPSDPWTAATNPLLGTRAIMDWIRDHYGRDYAPNSRETIRRFTLHQFAEATLVEENPDQPDRPINSPHWRYRVHPRALTAIQAFGGADMTRLMAAYLAEVPGLTAQHGTARQMRRVPATLPDGRLVALSPGGQNTLIKQIVEEFCPRYTPGGRVLYVGDADAKWAIFEEQALTGLGVALDQHGRMPDLVVHLPDRNWLVLIEAASTHGPINATRKTQLARIFGGATAKAVYVSCFPSRRDLRRYTADIAWETEAWCADNPTHLIHFNGERFLGPYD